MITKYKIISVLLFILLFQFNSKADILHLSTDSIAELLSSAIDNNKFDVAAELGYALITERESELIEKDYSPYIYLCTAHAFSSLCKFAIIPEIADKSKKAIKKHLTKSDSEYYKLPVIEAMAYLCMEKPEKSDSIYNKIMYYLYEDESRPMDIKRDIHLLKDQIDQYYEFKRSYHKQDRLKDLIDISQKMVFASKDTDKGVQSWKTYFEMMRDALINYYYDVNNPEDENIWSYIIAYYDIMFFLGGHDLEGREDIAYNKALVKKNFLEYHMGKIHKTPIFVHDVKNSLDSCEVAIEICSLPDEILILKKDLESPISVSIDSILIDELNKYDLRDAVMVNNLYTKDSSPLVRLWLTIEPYIKNARTIYLSTTNTFSCFNFSAIPLSPGQKVADKYDFHHVISTADISFIKRKEKHTNYKTAAIYGDINYNTSIDTLKMESSKYIGNGMWKSNMSLVFSQNNIGKFRQLQHSLAEVCTIDSILTDGGLKTRLLVKSNANEESFKRLTYEPIDILHISTHGFDVTPKYRSISIDTTLLSPTTTRQTTMLSKSGLVMSGVNQFIDNNYVFDNLEVDDGFLTSREILDIDLKGTNLAVLSACKTGLGNDNNVIGLVYGPQYALKTAGVEQVMLSLWDVDDEATSLLMKYFYESLIKGAQPRSALHEAQKQLISNGFTDPYYWAAFVVLE